MISMTRMVKKNPPTRTEPDVQFVLWVCFSVIPCLFCLRDIGMSQGCKRGEGEGEFRLGMLLND